MLWRRWLIDHGRDEQGLQTLARLHSNGDIHNEWVVTEFQSIKQSIDFEHEHGARSILELFQSRLALRRLVLCCAIQASIQMTGVAAIQYYAPQIYANIGKDFG